MLGVLHDHGVGLAALCLAAAAGGRRACAPIFAGAGPLVAFFAAIGLGFMLIETSQMQRLIIVLGHPAYGLSVVLFALLLSSGARQFPDAIASRRRNCAPRASGLLALLLASLVAFGLVTPVFARRLRGRDDAGANLAARWRFSRCPGCSWAWRFRWA